MLYIRFIDSFSNFYFDNRDRDVGRHCSVGYCMVVKTCHFSLKYVIFFLHKIYFRSCCLLFVYQYSCLYMFICVY